MLSISHSTNDLYSIIIIYEDTKHLTINHNPNDPTTLDCTIHTHHEHYHLTTIDLKEPNSFKKLNQHINEWIQ